jgi:pSer/pThr/pTyr-binding forkhead associated (FHA) protein
VQDRTIVDPGLGGGPGALEATRVISMPGAPTMGGGYDQTMQAITATCPVCSTPNPPSERYCQDCGFMFGSAPGEVEPLPDISTMPRLVETATGREFALNAGVNLVGRDSADVLIPDSTVSRRHAQLTLEEGKLFVEDLGSTNGTKLAGQQVRPGDRATAYDGDTLKFGNIIVTLSLPGGSARTEAPALPAAAVGAGETAAAPAEDRGLPVAAVVFPDGREEPLYIGINLLGRRSTSQIVIPDAFASGKHAEIHVAEDGRARLIDVGSTNGTFVAGARIAPNAPLELSDGMEVTLAKTPITFRSTAGAAALGEPEEDTSPTGEPEFTTAAFGDVPGGEPDA